MVGFETRCRAYAHLQLIRHLCVTKAARGNTTTPVELDLDQSVRTEPVDRQNPDTVALLRGPLVLFAISGHNLELPSHRLSDRNYRGPATMTGP